MTMISATRSLLAAVLLAASVPAANAVGGVHLAETTAKTRLDSLFAKLKGAAGGSRDLAGVDSHR
jgi:hypothetical protein